jgi:hypothetical protein
MSKYHDHPNPKTSRAKKISFQILLLKIKKQIEKKEEQVQIKVMKFSCNPIKSGPGEQYHRFLWQDTSCKLKQEEIGI